MLGGFGLRGFELGLVGGGFGIGGRGLFVERGGFRFGGVARLVIRCPASGFGFEGRFGGGELVLEIRGRRFGGGEAFLQVGVPGLGGLQPGFEVGGFGLAFGLDGREAGAQFGAVGRERLDLSQGFGEARIFAGGLFRAGQLGLEFVALCEEFFDVALERRAGFAFAGEGAVGGVELLLRLGEFGAQRLEFALGLGEGVLGLAPKLLHLLLELRPEARLGVLVAAAGHGRGVGLAVPGFVAEERHLAACDARVEFVDVEALRTRGDLAFAGERVDGLLVVGAEKRAVGQLDHRVHAERVEFAGGLPGDAVGGDFVVGHHPSVAGPVHEALRVDGAEDGSVAHAHEPVAVGSAF